MIYMLTRHGFDRAAYDSSSPLRPVSCKQRNSVTEGGLSCLGSMALPQNVFGPK